MSDCSIAKMMKSWIATYITGSLLLLIYLNDFTLIYPLFLKFFWLKWYQLFNKTLFFWNAGHIPIYLSELKINICLFWGIYLVFIHSRSGHFEKVILTDTLVFWLKAVSHDLITFLHNALKLRSYSVFFTGTSIWQCLLHLSCNYI